MSVPSRRVACLRALLGCSALVAPAVFLSPAAHADCVQVGNVVTCTGVTFNYSTTQSNLTVNLPSGASVIGSGADAIRIQNPGVTGDTLNNFGTIDGFVTILSTVQGVDTFNNSGVLKITDPMQLLQNHSMQGTNYVQSASGMFMARVDSNGFNDGILSWTASLNGALIAVVQPGIYTSSNTYAVITALNGHTGQFSSVTSSSPFFAISMDYSGPADVNLTLTPIAFNSVSGLTPNEQAVANVLQGAYSPTVTGNALTFYSNLFAATSVNIFDQLSGVATSATQDASFAAGSMFGGAMMQQGMSWLSGASDTSNSVTVGGALPYAHAYAAARDTKPGYEAFAAMRPAPTDPGRWRAWGAGFGGTRTVDAQASPGTFEQTINAVGGAMGVDHEIGTDALFGFAVGSSGSTFSVSSLTTNGRVDAGHAGVYAVKKFGDSYAAATVSYARLDNSTSRTIGFFTPENETARFASDQLSGRFELGWKRGFPDYSITPFVAVEPAVLWQRAYTETSTGVAPLNVSANTVTSLPTFVGAQIDTRFTESNGVVLSPFARVSWVHEFRPDRSITASFVNIPSASFTVDGARAAVNAARIEAGGTLALSKTASLFTRLTGEFGGGSTSEAITGGVNLTW